MYQLPCFHSCISPQKSSFILPNKNNRTNRHWCTTSKKELRKHYLHFIQINKNGFYRIKLCQWNCMFAYCSQLLWYQSIMSQIKFKSILFFLHLDDNLREIPKSQPSYDRLHKLGGWHKELNRLFPMMLSPTQYLSIDKQMTGINLRCSFIQYMWRTKIWD